MKRLLLFVMVCMPILFIKASAQPKMPGFVVADVNGKYHNIKTASIKKQVLLVYFMPDCDDCRAFTAKLAKHDQLFARYEVIMVTNSNLDVLKKFVAEFRLAGKPNLVIGTEGWTAKLQRSLKIERFPFVAAYDAKGVLMRNFTDANKLFDEAL